MWMIRSLAFLISSSWSIVVGLPRQRLGGRIEGTDSKVIMTSKAWHRKDVKLILSSRVPILEQPIEYGLGTNGMGQPPR